MSSKARKNRDKREQRSRRIEAYTWLGAGAVTLGVGAAMAGSGVAYADSGSDSGSPSGPARHAATVTRGAATPRGSAVARADLSPAASVRLTTGSNQPRQSAAAATTQPPSVPNPPLKPAPSAQKPAPDNSNSPGPSSVGAPQNGSSAPNPVAAQIAPAAAAAPASATPAPAAVAPAASSAPTATASTKTFTVHANPFLMSVSPDGRYVYTTNLTDSNGISGVSRLDTTSGDVSWLQQKDAAVYALTTGPNGNVYVLSNSKDSAVLETLGNGLNRVLGTTAISNTQGSAVSVSQNGRTAVVGGFDGKLSVIDIAANKVTKTVNVGSWVYGAAVSPDGKTAWVNTEGGTGVSAVNLTTGAITTVKLPSGDPIHPGSIAISADGRTVYAGGSQVAVIDAATKKVTGTVGAFPTNANIARIVASSDGKYLYTSDRGNQTISVISLPTKNIVKNIPVGGNGDVFGTALSPDNTTLYWADYDRSQIAQRSVAVVPTATNLFAPADRAANQVVVQKVLGPDNTTRMIVYMSGVNNDLSAKVQTFLGASIGKLQTSVNDYVNQAYTDWRPTEVMLVGLSGGGVQMQNYAAGGSNSDARKAIRTVLLYGAPLSKTSTDLGVGAKSKMSVLDIVDKGDKLVPSLSQVAAANSFTKSRNDKAAIYKSDTKSPSTDDPWNVLSYVIPVGNHSDTTYYSAAQEFDKYANSAKASEEFKRIKNDWQSFGGIILDERSTSIAYA